MDERLSYAHAGDHARLEHEAERVRYRGALGLPKDPDKLRDLRDQWQTTDEQHRLHLRTHLATYHATTLQDIADYGHEQRAEVVDMGMLRGLHQDLHSRLIDDTNKTDQD